MIIIMVKLTKEYQNNNLLMAVSVRAPVQGKDYTRLRYTSNSSH